MTSVDAPSRRWLRDTRELYKRLSRPWQADVLLLSPAKSGRTWLRAMLTHLYHLEYGTPTNELIRFGNFHRIDGRVPFLFFSHYVNEPAAVRASIALALLSPHRRVVVMVRDPRDVAVSYYYHMRYRASARERHRAGMPDSVVEQPIEAFMLDERFGLPAQIERTNRLHALARRAPRSLLLRYEDLRSRTREEVERLLAFLGHRFASERIERAIAFTSFDNLRALEARGFFRDMQPADPGNPASFKVRRGRIGGYRDELPAELCAHLDRMVEARLDPALGYAGVPATQPHATASATG